MPPLRLALVALAVLLITPAASAAAADGRLQVVGPLSLPQGGDVRADSGGLAFEGTALPTLTVEFGSATIGRTGTRTVAQANPLGEPIYVSSDNIDDRIHVDAGTLALEAGPDLQVLGILGTGPFALNATAADVRPVAAAKLVPAPEANDAETWGCRAKVDPNCLDVYGVYELVATGGDATMLGDVTFILRGPVAIVRDAGGETRYESGSTSSTTGSVTTTEDTWIRIEAQDATVHVAPAADALRYYAPAPTIDTASVHMSRATGALDVGMRSYRAVGDALDASGDLRLELENVPTGAMPRTSNVAYADGFTANVRGDVHAINLDAVPIFEDRPTETAGALLGIATALGALFYFAPALKFHATSALLPLYTRLRKPDILDNDVRNAIFETIKQNPGISARAIHRLSDQSWGTVVYHLRQLERHHVVVSRSLGRTRNYYENHGKYRGMEAQLACLQSDRARVLARIVAAEPGITQELLVERSGFPQPTTSYYVRKLKRAGLVEERREGRYAKYVPHAELPRFLELAADDAPPAPDAPASPANA